MQNTPNKNEKEVTAQPKVAPQTAGQMDYGKASVRDAKISGYTDEDGQAKQMAKPDVEGHPTGALTDIGAGRSSVVKSTRDSKKTVEDAPAVDEEQAP